MPIHCRGGFTLGSMRDAPISVSSRSGQNAETMIVEICGPLTLPNIFTFQERIAFLRVHSLISTLILDLTLTPYMDSAGLGCLINCYVSAKKNEQQFLLVGVNERLRALLETAHVDKMIPIYQALQDAERSVDNR